MLFSAAFYLDLLTSCVFSDKNKTSPKLYSEMELKLWYKKILSFRTDDFNHAGLSQVCLFLLIF